jgi:ribosomal protein L11 methylase PrmA
MRNKLMVLIIAAMLLTGAGLPAGRPRQQPDDANSPDVVYVGTPYDLVSKMLKMAAVKKGDMVYDLGCGDGRMVVLAAKKYGCRGRGYDIDPERVAASLENVKRNGVGHLVKILQNNIFALDLSDADVLLLYLLPELNERLVPQIAKLKPGSRLVLHDYGLPEFEADEVIEVISDEDNAHHTLYLYKTPLKREKG